MKLQPLWDYVLIDVDEVKKRTDSGFLLANSSKEVPPWGVVIATGPDCKTVKVDDRVLFARYSAIYVEEDVTEENSGYRLIKEKHIRAKDA